MSKLAAAQTKAVFSDQGSGVGGFVGAVGQLEGFVSGSLDPNCNFNKAQGIDTNMFGVTLKEKLQIQSTASRLTH